MRETTLPSVSGLLSSENPMGVLSAAGVIWHEPIGESVIYKVSLPLGWSKIEVSGATFKLLDDRGRDRATTFESSKPFITLSRRFRFSRDHEREKGKDPGEIVAYVRGENGIVLHTTQAVSTKHCRGEDGRHELRARVEEEAEKWLDEYYPNWRDPGAYWD